MKLINENGKVLGIINIIDLTVLLFIISAITGFSWLIYTGELFKNHNPYYKQFIEKDVEVILKNKIPQEILLLKDEMTKLKDSDSGIKILNVTVSQTKTSLNQGGIEIITNSYDAILLVRLKTHFDKYKNLYYYHSSPIEIGQTFEMETGLYNITATIIKT